MYTAAILMAAAAILLALTTLHSEDRQRRRYYRKKFCTDLILQSEKYHLTSSHYIIGRRKRKCDFYLGDRDLSVSRIHAILWYDDADGRYHIRPYRNASLRTEWTEFYSVWKEKNAERFEKPSVQRLARLFLRMDRWVARIDRTEKKIGPVIEKLFFVRKSTTEPVIYTRAQKIPAAGTGLNYNQDVRISNDIRLHLADPRETGRNSG